MTFEQWWEQAKIQYAEYIAQADDIENVLKRIWDAAQQAQKEKDTTIITEAKVKGLGPSGEAFNDDLDRIAAKLQEQP